MGWDASAALDGEPLAMSAEYWSTRDLPLRTAFERAEQELSLRFGGRCEYLASGQLSGSCQREMFERAIGMKVDLLGDGEAYLPPEDLAKMTAIIDWKFECPSDREVEYWMVRRFIEACLANNLGIYMSW